jgi:hypothetical protein
MQDNWKTRTILIGAIAGALVGLTAAMILIKDAEKKSEPPHLSPGDGVKLGLGVLGVLRMLSDGGGK